MDLDLHDRTALVTGGSRGIGRAIARQLGREGVRVAIVARSAEALRATALELSASTGSTVMGFTADMGVADDVARMTAEIQSAVKERKGSVQSPKQVVVVDSVPVTALGKPDKKAVRAQFWEGSDRRVG